MKKTILIQLLIGLLLLPACTPKSRFEIDTTENRVNVKINRLDSVIIGLDTNNIKQSIIAFENSYPDFYKEYTTQILGVSPSDTAEICKLFSKFNTDSVFTTVNNKVLSTFSDVSDIEKNISDAFTYIHHYFPEVKLPEIYFFVSGFNQSVILNENLIGIGTDLYLGTDFPQYESITYKYMTTNMRRECVASDVVSATLFRMFVMNTKEDRLIDNMIFRGKVMYLLSIFMPNELPETLMGYTAEQWKWSTTYEKEIWGAVIDQKHLFSTDMMTIRKYMNDAPFTAPISQDSPGRLGTWLGWRIVESYMNKNKNVGLKDLMNENDAQKLLENSEYRP